MKKTFSKTRNKCKVTFSYPDAGVNAVYVAGDFNGWDTNATPLKKGKGGYSATMELDMDKDYQYRFFVDNERWENDNNADGFAQGPYHDCQNCIVSTRS